MGMANFLRFKNLRTIYVNDDGLTEFDNNHRFAISLDTLNKLVDQSEQAEIKASQQKLSLSKTNQISIQILKEIVAWSEKESPENKFVTKLDTEMLLSPVAKKLSENTKDGIQEQINLLAKAKIEIKASTDDLVDILQNPIMAKGLLRWLTHVNTIKDQMPLLKYLTLQIDSDWFLPNVRNKHDVILYPKQLLETLGKMSDEEFENAEKSKPFMALYNRLKRFAFLDNDQLNQYILRSKFTVNVDTVMVTENYRKIIINVSEQGKPKSRAVELVIGKFGNEETDQIYFFSKGRYVSLDSVPKSDFEDIHLAVIAALKGAPDKVPSLLLELLKIQFNEVQSSMERTSKQMLAQANDPSTLKQIRRWVA
jgi:hypothetical protein